MTLYLKHFGMHEAPFRITPTTEFFYGGGRRGEILHALQYAIEVGEGIMMITGEVGSGKTMLLRTLSEKLPPEVELVYIANPSFSGRAILYNICEELELDIDIDRPDAVRRLQKYLIERHAQGKRVVALIDEAQAMPDESLEEIRLLSNLETGRNKLLQIAMFGQPELLDKLSRQNMRQLRERITVSLNLEPFSRDDIREYISTRLHASGYNGSELFSKDGCHLLAVVSQGLSRRINVLADKALLSAFERGHDKVTYDDVRRAVRDAKFGKMRYRSEQARRFSRHLTAGIAVTACIVLTIAISSRLGNLSEKTPPAAVAQSAADNSSSDSLSDSSSILLLILLLILRLILYLILRTILRLILLLILYPILRTILLLILLLILYLILRLILYLMNQRKRNQRNQKRKPLPRPSPLLRKSRPKPSCFRSLPPTIAAKK